MTEERDAQPVSPDTCVTILLAVYNGALHLPQQLASLAEQTHRNWRVLASDDGSDDGSVGILDSFAAQNPVTRISGPRRGFNRNFMHLFQALPDRPGVVALCDQDDVWLSGKLAAAVTMLAAAPDDVPALYCCRRVIWDGAEDKRRLSLLYARPPSFANALIENIAAGNTIVLNAAAAALVRSKAGVAGALYAYDWWIYQLVTGAGGHVYYDPTPWVLYRQHADNQIGAGETALVSIANKLAVLRGLYRARLTQHLDVLKACEALLTPQSRDQLNGFMAARAAPFLTRPGQVRRTGVYRQGRLSHLMFQMAVCLGRA